MKKLMILGAGVSQVPLIKMAKDMGLFTIVVSRPGNYPGFRLADKIVYEDTTDADKISALAAEEAIAGICTTGTDVAVPSIGKTCDLLGLKGISYAAAQLSSNKWKMKTAFMAHGVRTARFVQVHSKEEALQAFQHLTPPLVFKAVDSSGSRGIVKVQAASEIDYAYEEVRKATRENFFIVEEFIEGIEFGAQAFVSHGQLQFVMPHGDMMFYGDAGVPVGHYVPYELPDQAIEDIQLQLERSIDALQLNHCAMNADFILKDGQVYVLEIGGRAGATCLPELVSTHYGFNYYEQIIRAAIDDAPSFHSDERKPCACELLISDQAGIIACLEDHNAGKDDRIQVSFDYAAGDAIRKFRVGTDRIGQIVVRSDTLQEALDLLEHAKQNLSIKLAADN